MDNSSICIWRFLDVHKLCDAMIDIILLYLERNLWQYPDRIGFGDYADMNKCKNWKEFVNKNKSLICNFVCKLEDDIDLSSDNENDDCEIRCSDRLYLSFTNRDSICISICKNQHLEIYEYLKLYCVEPVFSLDVTDNKKRKFTNI